MKGTGEEMQVIRMNGPDDKLISSHGQPAGFKTKKKALTQMHLKSDSLRRNE